MIIERDTDVYSVLKVGDLEAGDIFEVTTGGNVGTPFLKINCGDIEESTVLCFNLSEKKEYLILKDEKCFLGINTKIKYAIKRPTITTTETKDLL